MAASPIVQYVVLRSDLQSVLKWPVGAMIAQACHACTAVFAMYKEDPHVVAYVQDLDNMRKVVLQAKDENQLRSIGEKLKEDGIDHKMWVEQPENIITCIVSKPYPKNEVQNYFKGLKLFK